MPGIETNLQLTLTDARKFLDAHKEEPGVGPTFGYFTTHPVAPLNHQRLKLLMRRISEVSKEKGRPLRILDLACGAGLITSAIAREGHSILGLDISDSEIALAERFARAGQSPARFLKCDLMTDPEWEAKIESRLGGKPDGVVLAYALHHLPGVEQFVERMAAWLPTGASLWINEENPHSPLFRLKHIVRTLIQRDTDVEWHRTLRGWSRLLEAHGFRIGRVEGADPLPLLALGSPTLCWSLVFDAKKI